MANYTDDFTKSSQVTINHLKEELKAIRTGRANPAILEDLQVEAYGGQSKFRMMELATITTEGPAQLVIAPYDPITAPDIERAILTSPMGLSPVSQGGRIIVRIPPLSQEQRQKLIKIVNQKIEEKKNIIRTHRDDVRKKIKQDLETSSITKDDKFRMEKDIDTVTSKLMEEIETIKKNKEKEIMEV